MAGNAENTVVDSPTGWVADHIQEYVESNGEKGHVWRKGTTILLLTTVGRKTGTRRRSALIYRKVGDAYVIVASRGGSPHHPQWYLNLQANPEVELQVLDEVFTARARTAEGEERAKLWEQMAEVWPDYLDYQTKTDREIPVVVLERIG